MPPKQQLPSLSLVLRGTTLPRGYHQLRLRLRLRLLLRLLLLLLRLPISFAMMMCVQRRRCCLRNIRFHVCCR